MRVVVVVVMAAVFVLGVFVVFRNAAVAVAVAVCSADLTPPLLGQV